jgi:replicative DNA helicase
MSDLNTSGERIEMQLLGTCLIDGASLAFVMHNCSEDDFASERNRVVFNGVKFLFARGMAVLPEVLIDTLASSKKIDKAGGPIYVASLINDVVVYKNVPTFVGLLKNKKVQRLALEIGGEISELSKSPEYAIDSAPLVDLIQKKAIELSNSFYRHNSVSTSDVVSRIISGINVLGENAPSGGLKTGYKALDNAVGYFYPGDYLLIGGRPGMGKSSLVYGVVSNMSVKATVPGAVISTEVSLDDITAGVISNVLEISRDSFRNGRMSKREIALLNSSEMDRVRNAPMQLYCQPGMTLFELIALIRRLVYEYGIKYVVIDFIQKVRSDREYRSRDEELEYVSNGIKDALAKMGLFGIVVSQLSRQTESSNRVSTIPRLSDLRGSGALEQDADFVVFPYRPAYYGAKARKDDRDMPEGTSKMVFAKNKYGRLNDDMMTFIESRSMFVDYDVNSSAGMVENSSFQGDLENYQSALSDDDLPF